MKSYVAYNNYSKNKVFNFIAIFDKLQEQGQVKRQFECFLGEC